MINLILNFFIFLNKDCLLHTVLQQLVELQMGCMAEFHVKVEPENLIKEKNRVLKPPDTSNAGKKVEASSITMFVN